MSDNKMTVWALFDSGNGSYTKGVTAFDELDKLQNLVIEIFTKAYNKFLQEKQHQ